MILLDANVLIYAHSSSMPHHRAARTWLDGVLNGSAPVGIPWPSLLAFLRILSNPRAVPKPSSIMALWRQVNDWLTVENVWIPTPHERHAQIFASLLPLAATHLLVEDAHLAALAIEHNLTLYSTDGDFARFPGLRWENPLATASTQSRCRAPIPEACGGSTWSRLESYSFSNYPLTSLPAHDSTR